MIIHNVYPERNFVRFEKMCNKPSKSGINAGDLCVAIEDKKTKIINNYHLKKENVIDFMLIHYKKEILKRLGITITELNHILLAKEV